MNSSAAKTSIKSRHAPRPAKRPTRPADSSTPQGAAVAVPREWPREDRSYQHSWASSSASSYIESWQQDQRTAGPYHAIGTVFTSQQAFDSNNGNYQTSGSWAGNSTYSLEVEDGSVKEK